MPRDLLKEAGYTPEQIQAIINEPEPDDNTPQPYYDPEYGVPQKVAPPRPHPPRDLLKEAGYTPEQIQEFINEPDPWMPKPPQSTLDKIANSDAVNMILGAGDAISGFPAQVANFMMPQSLQAPIPKHSEGLAYDVGSFGGDLASFLGGGELLDMARAGAEGLPVVGDLAHALGGTGFSASAIGRRALGSGLYGAIQNPDDNHAALTNAGISVALDALLGTGGKALSNLGQYRPTRYFRGNLTPDELMRNVKAAEGTRTPLGDVIQSPSLNKLYENILLNQPGTIGDEVTADIQKSIVRKGDNILNKYLDANDPNDINDLIADSLQESFINTSHHKNRLYNEASDIAEGLKLKFNMPNFMQSTLENKKFINDDITSGLKTAEKITLSKLLNLNKPVANPKQSLILDASGNPQVISQVEPQESLDTTLTDLNTLAAALKRNAYKRINSIDPSIQHVGNVQNKLGSAIKNDIYNSVQSSNHKPLIDAFTKAENFYKTNYAQWLDKDLKKAVNTKTPPSSIIPKFLKTGENDNVEQLNKLMNVLPPENRNLVSYAYLSKALQGDPNFRQVNPNNLKTLWTGKNKLGMNQKSALIPDEANRQELYDYANLVRLNEEALNRMHNPQTGARTNWTLSHLGPTGILGSLGASWGSKIGGFPGGFLGWSVGSSVNKAIANAMIRRLTSPIYRENFVRKMISNDRLPRLSHVVNAPNIADALKLLIMKNVNS